MAGSNPCWDFDTSYDGSSRFMSLCTAVPSSQRPGLDAIQGPSQIFVQSTYGGPGRALYRDPKFAVTTVRAITRHTLLFLIKNEKFLRGGGIDTSENGLWEINVDGSGLKRLASDIHAANFALNQFTQYPWSNVSRDSSLYALSQSRPGAATASFTRTLFIGSLHGGTLTTIATLTDTQTVQLAVAGWTTM